MASAFSSRCLRANILHLPPSIRTNLYANAASCRSFSSTPQRKVDASTTLNLTQLAVAGPTAALDGIHSLGIPWCAAIPITAVLVRGVFGYYFAAKPNHQRQVTRINLMPLINMRFRMWMNNFQAKWLDDHKDKNTPEGVRKIAWASKGIWIFMRESFLVGRQFGAPIVTLRSWVNFAALVAFTEAVRIKCGTREGLLSLFLGPLDLKKDTSAPLDPAEVIAQRLAAGYESQVSKSEQLLSSDGMPDGNTLANQFQLPNLNTGAQTYFDLTDPTLKVEGFSWLQDLTLPDSTFVLPATLCVFMAANVLLRPRVKKEPNRVKDLVDKLQDLDEKSKESSEVKPEARTINTPINKPDPFSNATQDVLHAMQVAEQVRVKSAKKGVFQEHIFKKLTGQQRFSLILSFWFLFIGAQLPAALTLYMATAMGTAWVQRRWLDVRYPSPTPILPCRRPMRLKVKPEYRDA